MIEVNEIASGLRFPEGPIAMTDGTFLVVEMEGRRLTRIDQQGGKSVVAETGGGPNGAAIGPDGRCYICNNGGFLWRERDGVMLPGLPPDDFRGGWIEAVDLKTGEVEVLYKECDGRPLKGPNDIVFDETGGFWFTDHGKIYRHTRDRGAVFYAQPDGALIKEVVGPLDGPNGIGLSPDGTRLYVAESPGARLWAFDLDSPGKVRKRQRKSIIFEPGELLVGLPGHQVFDSLAVDSQGNICIATIGAHSHGITVVSADGSSVTHVPMPDPITTNICFGGLNLSTAYVTLSSTGKLVGLSWQTPGAPLHFLNQ